MAITRFSKDMNIINSLPDQPTLTTTELKKKFDEGGKAIKDFLNGEGDYVGVGFASQIDDKISEMEDDVEEAIEGIPTTMNNILYGEGGSVENPTSTSVIGKVNTSISTLSSSVDTKVANLTSYVDTKVAGTLKYSDFSVTTASFGASCHGGNRNSGTTTASNAGYYPLGIVGSNRNGDNGQARSANLEGLYLSARASGSATITCVVKGSSSEDVNHGASGTCYILWVKI